MSAVEPNWLIKNIIPRVIVIMEKLFFVGCQRRCKFWEGALSYAYFILFCVGSVALAPVNLIHYCFVVTYH